MKGASQCRRNTGLPSRRQVELGRSVEPGGSVSPSSSSSHPFTRRRLAAHEGPLVNRLPAVAGYRISNRHSCRLETRINPSASTKLLLLIVSKSGVIQAWFYEPAPTGLNLKKFARRALLFEESCESHSISSGPPSQTAMKTKFKLISTLLSVVERPKHRALARNLVSRRYSARSVEQPLRQKKFVPAMNENSSPSAPVAVRLRQVRAPRHETARPVRFRGRNPQGLSRSIQRDRFRD